jgi:hypothetical protein
VKVCTTIHMVHGSNQANQGHTRAPHAEPSNWTPLRFS